MELGVDPAQSIQKSAVSLQRSHLWILGLAVDGLAVDDRGSPVGPGRPTDSYVAACECPDDCLRDHENE